MKTRTLALVVVAFVAGCVVGMASAGSRPIDPGVYTGKAPKDAAAALVAIAKQQTEGGSWENIHVGRVLYLGGDAAEGRKILDEVASRKKVEASDWFRLGKVYYEAGEWDQARAAFDKALQLKPREGDWLAVIGSYHNLKGDRQRAEELFGRSFKLESDSVWNTANIAGSYLGVVPQ